MKSITLETLAEISADYTPERPAPFCQDHDDPNFSDYGNPAEIDNIHVEFLGIDITDDLPESVMEKISNMLYNKGELL